MDTHCSLEHIEKHDVPCRKARDEHAADVVLLRGEFASEYYLAPLARYDSGVICELGEAFHIVSYEFQVRNAAAPQAYGSLEVELWANVP